MKYFEDEPFMLRKRSDKEIADYDAGFQAGSNGEETDDNKSERGCAAGLMRKSRTEA